jgi:uncharacterized protein YybS (DUF2232 family)
MNYLLLIQTMISSIHAVEQLMPESTGKQKFDAAVTMVEAVVGDVQPMIPALMTVATTIVNGLRATGVFKAKSVAVVAAK